MPEWLRKIGTGHDRPGGDETSEFGANEKLRFRKTIKLRPCARKYPEIDSTPESRFCGIALGAPKFTNCVIFGKSPARRNFIVTGLKYLDLPENCHFRQYLPDTL